MVQDHDESGRSEVLQLRVTPGLKQQIRVEAAKQGKSMSDWLRGEAREGLE